MCGKETLQSGRYSLIGKASYFGGQSEIIWADGLQW